MYIYIYNYKQILDIAVGTNAINPLVHIIDDIYIYTYMQPFKLNLMTYFMFFGLPHIMIAFPGPTARSSGHYTIGKEIVDLVLDRIRKLADNCTGVLDVI